MSYICLKCNTCYHILECDTNTQRQHNFNNKCYESPGAYYNNNKNSYLKIFQNISD